MDNVGTEPKRRGRKKAFQRDDSRAGAPQITIRLAPDVLTRVKNHPEGTRPYVERLVREDVDREAATALVVSTDPADVPGQLLITDADSKS